jgi:RNA polymerase sigma factor (sigma-70 family)
MIDELKNFQGLLSRIKDGDESAARELVDRYGQDIRNAVRRSLDRRLRPKFDSLDFVQLVWSSFFRQGPQQCQFSCPDDFISYLIVIARNKVGMEARRRFATKKFNVNREKSLDADVSVIQDEMYGNDPSPLDMAIAKECWSQLLSEKPEHYQQIIHLRLRGSTCQEIADILQIDESTVRRFLKRLQRDIPE